VKKSFDLISNIVPFVIIIILWEILASAGFLNSSLFPSPTSVLHSFVEMVSSSELFIDLSYTLGRTFIGFVLGSIIGIVLGVLTARINIVRRLIEPIIQVCRPIPPIAIVPLAVVWLGLSEFSKITIIVWGVFFPVWINTHLGVAAVENSLIWAARSLGVSEKRLLFFVIIPASLRLIIAGMRVAIAIAFICVVVSEMMGATAGIGYRINTSYLVFRVDRMIVGLLVLGALGALADWSFVKFINRIFPWLHSEIN